MSTRDQYEKSEYIEYTDFSIYDEHGAWYDHPNTWYFDQKLCRKRTRKQMLYKCTNNLVFIFLFPYFENNNPSKIRRIKY